MGQRPGRAGWLVPGAALATLLFVQALRVWFPTVLFVVGDAGSTSAATMGAFALGCLLIGPVAAVVLVTRSGVGWWVGGSTLAVAMTVFPVTDGGAPQAVVATIAVVGGALALTSLAALPGSGTTARAGVVFGLAAEVTIHATLGTATLAWQAGPAPTLVRLLLAAALLIAVRGSVRDVRLRPESASGAAWPWLILAPLFLLVLVVAGAPGRVAVATGWPTWGVTAAVVSGQALAVLGVLLAPRLGATVAAATGGGLALIGAAGALQASGLTSVLSQVALAAGLAIIAVTEPTGTRSAAPARRALAAGAGLFGFGVLTFVYYAAYDIPLGFYNRAVLLVAAIAAAVLAGAATRRARAPSLRPALDLHRLAQVAIALLVVVAASGLARFDTTDPQTAAGEVGAELTLMLYNLHMGFDLDGRLAIDAMEDVIREHDPDILVLNEVDRGWLTTGGQDLLQLLTEDLALAHAFAPAADEVWGNAVLTRFPIVEVSSGRLPRGNDPMPRSQLAVVLDVAEGQQIGVVGTHLTHVEDQGATRLPQARAVAGTVAWYRERGLPTVVMGDLNAHPDSAELETFGSFVGPTLRRNNPTWPSGAPTEQIDHILVSSDLRVVDAQVVDTPASDHLPVVVTVTIDPA